MSTDDPVLIRLQENELEPSKTEGRIADKSDHLRHQMGKRQASHLGREDEVSNVYVTYLLDKRCDLINTGQLMYK